MDFLPATAIVERSTTATERMDEVENWVNGTASQATGRNKMDQIQHLAKVRVAGSNPVFRQHSFWSGPKPGAPELQPSFCRMAVYSRR
jgi:hypothetical protein